MNDVNHKAFRLPIYGQHCNSFNTHKKTFKHFFSFNTFIVLLWTSSDEAMNVILLVILFVLCNPIKRLLCLSHDPWASAITARECQFVLLKTAWQLKNRLERDSVAVVSIATARQGSISHVLSGVSWCVASGKIKSERLNSTHHTHEANTLFTCVRATIIFPQDHMHSCTLTHKLAATARIILNKLIITGCAINAGSYRVSGRQANESAVHGRGRTRLLNWWRFISVLLRSSSSVLCWQSRPISRHRGGEVAEEVLPRSRNCEYEQNSVEAECTVLFNGFTFDLPIL